MLFAVPVLSQSYTGQYSNNYGVNSYNPSQKNSYSSTSITGTFTADALAQKYYYEGKSYFDIEDYETAIDKYNIAYKMKPNDEITYALSYAHFKNKNYKNALVYINPLIRNASPKVDYFRIAANSHDILGDYIKAKEVMRIGFKKLPKAGELFLDWGVIEMIKGDIGDGIRHWEKGIEVVPEYAENYLWAAKYYAQTDKKMWAILYAESYLNLAEDSEHFKDVANIIVDCYKYLMTGNDSFDKPTIKLNDKRYNEVEVAFESITNQLKDDYASIFKEEYISLDNLYGLRISFYNAWNDKYSKSINVPLFNKHTQIDQNGYLHAYHYWLFGSLNNHDFKQYIIGNSSSFNAFLSWFPFHDFEEANNKLPLRSRYFQ